MSYFIMDSKGPNVFSNELFLGWVAGYGILVVGWINIQPREGGLEMQQVGKPREHFTFSYLLPLSSSRSRSRRSEKRELALLMGSTIPAWRKQHLKRGTNNHFWWNNSHSLFPSK